MSGSLDDGIYGLRGKTRIGNASTSIPSKVPLIPAAAWFRNAEAQLAGVYSSLPAFIIGGYYLVRSTGAVDKASFRGPLEILRGDKAGILEDLRLNFIG